MPEGKVVGSFRHQVLRSKRQFDRRSFRTVPSGTHRVVVGCPKGFWKKGRCSTATRAQKILHPVKEGNPCATCALIKLQSQGWTLLG